MQMNALGRSGLKVSRLCFGTLTMSPLQRNLSPEEGARLLVHAYERGVRFLDTAVRKLPRDGGPMTSVQLNIVFNA